MIKFLLIFFFFNGLFLMASEPWKLEKNSAGIKIYTRSIKNSNIKEFKAYATINAPKSKVFFTLYKISDFVKWYPDIMESKTLKIINQVEKIIYYKIDVPWPADNRDMVLKLKVVRNRAKKETIIYMKSITGYKNKVSGIVRIKKAYGFWKLTADGNKTKVHYQFLANPGGSLPTWIINMFIVDSPFNTIKALRKKVI